MGCPCRGLVSSDFNIPLFSEVYPGNQADSVTFASVTEQLVERYRLLAQDLEHVTLVLDKGNNSKKNLNELAQSEEQFIGDEEANSLKSGPQRFAWRLE